MVQPSAFDKRGLGLRPARQMTVDPEACGCSTQVVFSKLSGCARPPSWASPGGAGSNIGRNLQDGPVQPGPSHVILAVASVSNAALFAQEMGSGVLVGQADGPTANSGDDLEVASAGAPGPDLADIAGDCDVSSGGSRRVRVDFEAVRGEMLQELRARCDVRERSCGSFLQAEVTRPFLASSGEGSRQKARVARRGAAPSKGGGLGRPHVRQRGGVRRFGGDGGSPPSGALHGRTGEGSCHAKAAVLALRGTWSVPCSFVAALRFGGPGGDAVRLGRAERRMSLPVARALVAQVRSHRQTP